MIRHTSLETRETLENKQEMKQIKITPQIAQRLILARRALGLSQEELAKKVGKHQSDYSPLEKPFQTKSGKAPEVKEELFIKIASALGKKMNWFMMPVKSFSYFGQFRKSSRANIKAIKSIESIAETQSVALCMLINHDDLGFTPDLRFLDEEYIPKDTTPSEKAILLRKLWKINPAQPIPNLHTLVQTKGIFLFSHSFDNMDGCYIRQEIIGDSSSPQSSYPLSAICIYVNRNSTYHRSQATIAHELGHILCRHAEFLEKREKEEEEEAWEFAGEFLLPKRQAVTIFNNSLKLNDYRKISEYYGVSMQMAIQRAHKLGLISPTRHTSLMKELSAKGERKLERHDLPLTEGSFHLTKEILNLLKRDFTYTADDIEDWIGFSSEELISEFGSSSLRMIGIDGIQQNLQFSQIDKSISKIK